MCYFLSVYNILTKRKGWISRRVSGNKLDVFGALRRSFFEIFLKRYFDKTEEKLRKNRENLRHNDF